MNKMFVTKEPIGGFKCIEEIELYEDKEWELEDYKSENIQKIQSKYYDYIINKKFNQELEHKLKQLWLEMFNEL